MEKFVSENIIKSYVFKIEAEIINGSRGQAEKLFELFGDKLHLYPEESKNTILIYLYSCLGVCQSYSINQNLYSYASRGIIDKMNLYLDNSKPYYNIHLNVIQSIIEKIADMKEDSEKWETREAFKSLQKGISDNEYESFISQPILQPNIADFTKILNDENLLPF